MASTPEAHRSALALVLGSRRQRASVLFANAAAFGNLGSREAGDSVHGMQAAHGTAGRIGESLVGNEGSVSRYQ